MFRTRPFFFIALLLSLWATPLLTAASAPLVSINIIDRNGLSQTITAKERLKRYNQVDFLRPQPYQKVMRVFRPSRQGGSCAIITSYHPNGQVKQYLEVKNNRALGKYREWFPSGSRRLEAKVIGGVADINPTAEKSWVFDEKCVAWHEEGSIAAEILYTKGVIDGVSTYYHPTGQVWKKVPYKNNLIEGTQKVYLPTGELFTTAEYHEGLANGKTIKYWAAAPNKCAAEENFKQGRLITGHYFNKNGETIAQIEAGSGYRALFGKEMVCELQQYQDGVLDGEVRSFSTDGQLAKIHHIKNGIKNGEEKVFYHSLALNTSDVKPQMSLNWHEGKIQGVVKTWYDTGHIESQREMSENRKHGHSTAWYPDGSLMLVEEYDMDKLVKGEYHKIKETVPVSRVIDGNGICTLFSADGHFLRKVQYFDGEPQG